MGHPALEVPGDVDDDDALVAADEEQQLKELRALIMKEVLPPLFHDEFGNQDGDLAVRMAGFEQQDVVNQWHEDEAER